MAFRGIPLVLSMVLFMYLLFQNSAQKLVLRTSPTSPVYAAVNSNLVLTCSINNINSLTLRWKSYTNAFNITESNRSLTSLAFHRLQYTDEGVYSCQAFNQTSALIIAEKNVTVKVGDPPPKSPSPTIKRVCGYKPPSEIIVSFNYTAPLPTSMHFQVTVDLVICPVSMTNYCGKVCDNFTVVKGSRQIIDGPKPKHYSFEVNAADTLKTIVPNFPLCTSDDSVLDCSFLCIRMRSRNAFGTMFSEPTLKKIKEYSGEVANFRAVEVGLNSITVAWELPNCLRNRTGLYRNLYYFIWCETCGSRMTITSNVNVLSGLNKTLHSLNEYTNYTIYARSSFFNDFKEAAEPVSITVQTKEGVPKSAPAIDKLMWLSEECTESNGTALVSWKVYDKSALLGKVRQYIITYKVAYSSLTTTRNVSAHNHRLEISGLQMDKNYTFAVRVCTGGGCSKPSSDKTLSSMNVRHRIECTSSDTPPDGANTSWQWMLPVVAALTVTAICLFIIGSFWKQKRNARVNLRPVLPDEINPTPDQPEADQTEPDNEYACADGQFSSSTDLESLSNGPQDLQRSPSVLTCSTEI